jgi:hypothetical protein
MVEEGVLVSGVEEGGTIEKMNEMVTVWWCLFERVKMKEERNEYIEREREYKM